MPFKNVVTCSKCKLQRDSERGDDGKPKPPKGWVTLISHSATELWGDRLYHLCPKCAVNMVNGVNDVARPEPSTL